jgi:hypothetical protein
MSDIYYRMTGGYKLREDLSKQDRQMMDSHFTGYTGMIPIKKRGDKFVRTFDDEDVNEVDLVRTFFKKFQEYLEWADATVIEYTFYDSYDSMQEPSE